MPQHELMFRLHRFVRSRRPARAPRRGSSSPLPPLARKLFTAAELERAMQEED